MDESDWSLTDEEESGDQSTDHIVELSSATDRSTTSRDEASGSGSSSQERSSQSEHESLPDGRREPLVEMMRGGQRALADDGFTRREGTGAGRAGRRRVDGRGASAARTTRSRRAEVVSRPGPSGRVAAVGSDPPADQAERRARLRASMRRMINPERDFFSDDSDSTLNGNDGSEPGMFGIFSDEATISDDDSLFFNENGPDFLSAVNMSGLQGLRVIVEELSNQDMALRGGASSVEISSDEDNDEQRRVWRRRGVETANARRRGAARNIDGGQSSSSGATAGASAQTTDTNEWNVPQQDAHSSGSKKPSEEYTQGPSKRSRLDPDVANEPVPVDSEEANRVATCSICLDEMNQGGDHRLIVLKCGHCFGESCAKRWLMSGKRCCPMCNRQASLKHMRVAFLDCHRLGESYELAEARKELDELRQQERTSADRVRELNFRIEALVGQNELLNERVRQLEKGAYFGQAYASQGSNDFADFPKTQSFTKLTGHCKYMAYSDKLGLIAVSAKPATRFFDGFTVELCSLYDLKSRRSKLLHSQEIKDLDFHRNNQWLLTASLDSSARISSVDNLGLTNIHTLQLNNKLWSSCWSNASDTNFYLGLSNGEIFEYDVRSLREEVQVLRGPSNNMRIPIVSLKSITVNQGRREIHGLACSQLRNNVRIYTEVGPNRYNAQNIPTAGNCFSLSYYAPNETLLVNSRTFSGQGLKGVTNEVFSLEARDGETLVSAKCRFQSGGSSSVITKPTVVPSPSGDLWACCLDDQANTIQVFCCDDASLKLTLKSKDPLGKQFTQVEKISLRGGRTDYALAGLSDGGLTIFT